MSHQHHHDSHHHHSVESANINRAFWIGIMLNTAFVIIEFIAGFMYNSLALLSDAGHNLSDVASLGLSLFAFKLAKAKSTERFTYGYHKGTILASLVNAVILLIAVGSIGWEAIQRFQHPEETKGTVISIVAAIGIVINAASALLFFRNKEKDLNIKGAYLHLATDALVSLGVVIAGILITYTGIKWIDPLISLLIMAVVIYGTWSLLIESLKLSLDAVPEQIQLDKIKETAVKIAGIKSIEHIHIWAMSTTKIAMTAHVIVDEKTSMKQIQSIKKELKHQLEHEGIQHVTIETVSSNADKDDDPC
ncbi:MAG: cation transporter [Sphingobacteriales bacterium]|nr:MAG: cation transporter [Sphingobacteriales bacterium]